MADVNLVVRAHLRGERELNKAERKLLKIAVAARAADNSMASLGTSSAKMQKILSLKLMQKEIVVRLPSPAMKAISASMKTNHVRSTWKTTALKIHAAKAANAPMRAS